MHERTRLPPGKVAAGQGNQGGPTDCGGNTYAAGTQCPTYSLTFSWI